MENVKEFMFVIFASAFVILGLASLNIFGVTLVHIPLLFSAAIIGILVYKLHGFKVVYAVIAALAGAAGAMVLAGNPSLESMASLASAFAISFVLPLIFLSARKRLIKKAN